MVYGGSKQYRSEGGEWEFSSAELFAGARSGRLTIRERDESSMYVTVHDAEGSPTVLVSLVE